MYLMFPHDRQNLVIKKSLKFPRDVNIAITKYPRTWQLFLTIFSYLLNKVNQVSFSFFFFLNILIIKCSVGWSIIGWLTPLPTKFHPYSILLAKKKKDPKKKGCVLEVKRGDGIPFLLKSILYNYNNYFDKIPVQKTSIQETFQLL